jgi:hypothetical protein
MHPLGRLFALQEQAPSVFFDWSTQGSQLTGSRILEAMVNDVLHIVSESFVQFVSIHILQHAHFFRRHVKPILFFWTADAQHHVPNAERPPQTFPVVVV